MFDAFQAGTLLGHTLEQGESFLFFQIGEQLNNLILCLDESFTTGHVICIAGLAKRLEALLYRSTLLRTSQH